VETLTYNQQYYRNNREREKARSRNWAKANPEKVAARNRRRYADPAARAKHLAGVKQWAIENPVRYAEIHRGVAFRHRLKKFGLTVEQYDAMLAAQGNCCAICRTDDPGIKQGAKRRLENGWPIVWNIDHDHETGEVRGLLCRGCNIALGAVRENATTLAAMIKYVNKRR
jgi:hypothetical protein